MSWVRLDDLSADYTIFSKDRNAFPSGKVLKLSVLSSSGALSTEIWHSYNSWATQGTITTNTAGSNVVTAANWHLVGFSLDIAATAVDTDTSLWIDNETHENSTMSGYVYLEDVAAHKAFIGAHRSATNTYEGDLKGFMYNVFLYNNETPTGSPHYSVTCSGCA